MRWEDWQAQSLKHGSACHLKAYDLGGEGRCLQILSMDAVGLDGFCKATTPALSVENGFSTSVSRNLVDWELIQTTVSADTTMI